MFTIQYNIHLQVKSRVKFLAITYASFGGALSSVNILMTKSMYGFTPRQCTIFHYLLLIYSWPNQCMVLPRGNVLYFVILCYYTHDQINVWFHPSALFCISLSSVNILMTKSMCGFTPRQCTVCHYPLLIYSWPNQCMVLPLGNVLYFVILCYYPHDQINVWFHPSAMYCISLSSVNILVTKSMYGFTPRQCTVFRYPLLLSSWPNQCMVSPRGNVLYLIIRHTQEVIW